MKSNFLTLDEIPVGSWWAMASQSEKDGYGYGYCVISKDAKTKDVTVLSTLGETRTIDFFKLQYRYKQVVLTAPTKS